MRRLRAYLATFRGFEPDARRFLFSGLLAGAAISLYWIDFNLYLSALGIDAPTIGLIATTGSLAAALIAFPASRASDLLGRRWLLIAGMALMALALAGLVVSTAPLAIAALVAVYGGGQQAFFVVQNPFLMERSRPEHRNELFSVAFAIENVTNVVAAIVGGVLAQAIAAAGGFAASGPEPFRVLLVGMAVMMTIALATLFRLTDDRPRPLAPSPGVAADPPAGAAEASVVAAPRRGAPRQRQPERLGARRVLSYVLRPRLAGGLGDRRTFVRLLIPGFLIALGAGQIIPFLNLFIEWKFGLEIAALNAVFAITSLGTIAAILVQPALARRLGKVASVVLVQGMSIPFLLVLGFSPALWTVIGAMAVRSSLMNAGNPIANAFSMEQVAAGDRATLSAAQSLLWSLGWVIAGPWYSLTQAVLGPVLAYPVNFATIIVLYTVATALYWSWFHDAERRVVPVAATG